MRLHLPFVIASLAASLALAGCASGDKSAAAGSASKSASSLSLDGSHWNVKVTPDAAAAKAGEQPFEDTIDFEHGRVSMSVCVKLGFEPSTYTATRTSDGFTFQTEQKNDVDGSAIWQGEAHANSMLGTLVCTKMDGRKFNYRFTGTKTGG